MKDKNQPCIVCGKPTARVYMVNYDNDSGRVVDLDFTGPDSGMQPIGADCKRLFPTEWIWVVRTPGPIKVTA